MTTAIVFDRRRRRRRLRRLDGRSGAAGARLAGRPTAPWSARTVPPVRRRRLPRRPAALRRQDVGSQIDRSGPCLFFLSNKAA